MHGYRILLLSNSNQAQAHSDYYLSNPLELEQFGFYLIKQMYHDEFGILVLQVVWDNSRDLGCGATRCSTLVNFPAPDALFLVCNYGPS